MDITIFTQMLRDKHFVDYKKMSYKYPKDFDDFLDNLKSLYYKSLPLLDSEGNNLVFVDGIAKLNQNSLKLLLKSQTERYGILAAEQEIISTCAIENIDYSRESIRNILKGFAPKDEQEDRIMGLKRGFEFISNPANSITEENIYALYMMTIGNYLSEENKLKAGKKYRHDNVYVISDKIEHTGIEAKKIPTLMSNLVDFTNAEDDINDLVKAAIIHYYIDYVHPYFDGNGRMSRLLHLWFLIQKNYESALFLPFSSQVNKNKKAYYDSFTLIEKNKEYSDVIDITPFIIFFFDCVYNKIESESTDINTLQIYEEAVKAKKITEKETNLWKFVLSYYGTGEFSTKQLERDFGNAAYATIRSFVMKFEKLGLLSSQKLGARVKYRVNTVK